MFDFLRSPDKGHRFLTGHANGLITLNVEEADDSKREKIRHEMREPYRTLLGHFRHEIGHYYWDRLVVGTPWLAKFRTLFGDERQDTPRRSNGTTSKGRRQIGRTSTSVRMHRCIPGKIGGELGSLPARRR